MDELFFFPISPLFQLLCQSLHHFSNHKTVLLRKRKRLTFTCFAYLSKSGIKCNGQWRRQGGGARGANLSPPKKLLVTESDLWRATKGYKSVLSLSENVWLISCHYSLVNARIHETVFYSFNITL